MATFKGVCVVLQQVHPYSFLLENVDSIDNKGKDEETP